MSEITQENLVAFNNYLNSPQRYNRLVNSYNQSIKDGFAALPPSEASRDVTDADIANFLATVA